MTDLTLPTEWSKTYEIPLERGKIRDIARAAGSTNRDYLEDPNPPAPPAFFYAWAYLWGNTWENPGESPLHQAPVDPSRLLHAEEEVEFPGEPPRAPTTLLARMRLESMETKTSRSSGRELVFVRNTTEFTDGEGTIVAIARSTVVEEREPQQAGS